METRSGGVIHTVMRWWMMGRHPAVHRGDDVCANGLPAHVGAIGQPLGTGLRGDQRREG